ncbi:MAG TPA: glycosyltransferase family 39 protein [Candidatus Acidoferrales bacterium]|nr:glycosyltransferase family 39 protein [Candidatus Acidoferrales bacterium]
MNDSTKMRLGALGAVLAAIALRIYFVWQFPFFEAGDTPIYRELAENWLRHGIYGLDVLGRLQAVDIRMPGYPAFLAGIYSVFGESARAVMLAQAGIDVLTCVLAAGIAAVIAPKASRSRVALAALWMAAVCPFTANYTAVVLTETLATFLTALALLVLLEAMREERLFAGEAQEARGVGANAGNSMRWLLGGIVAGFGTLVRPETPLLLAGVGVVLVVLWRRPANWAKLARATALMAVGLALPLLPWVARNWQVLHEVQFLAPRNAEMPGEYVHAGFSSWEKTWLWRFGDVFTVSWNVDGEEIHPQDLPASAFDSQAERENVLRLLAQYNESTKMTPELDRQFGEIARERTERHPLRTYVTVPLLRALTLWFAPRIEMLPLSGHLWPIAKWWQDSESEYCYSLGLFLIGIAYGVMAFIGAWRSWRNPMAMALVAFIVIRTAFLTTVEGPEPRYVLECFPAVFALAAQLWTKRAAASGQIRELCSAEPSLREF